MCEGFCVEDVNFNASQLSFEKKETEAVFSHAIGQTPQNRTSLNLKENTNNYRNKVLTSQNTAQRTPIGRQKSMVLNDFKMLIGCC